MKSFLPCVQTRNITTTIPALNKQIESQVKKQNQLDFSMPQWVQLPPNLVPEKHTMGKSIYTTDYSRKRPGFQLHLQNARGFRGSKHRPQAPKKPDKTTMRAHQTGNYLDFKGEFERALSTVENNGAKHYRLNLDVTTPDNSRSAASPSEKVILRKFIEPTLELVEEAWSGEASTTKRNRDRLHGLAGRKIELQVRPGGKQTKKKPSGLPGLNNWLRSSNEYEKAVVYNFMDAVCKASTDHVPTRTMVPNLVEKTSIKPQFPKELYHQQRAKSARSQRVTERPFIPPRPKSVGSMRDEDPPVENYVMEHAHYNHPHHTEGKCEFCDYVRVKKLLEHLNKYGSNSFGDAALSHLLRPRIKPTSQYPSQLDDDYVHENSFFSNTNAGNRGYFIIAPDWVSERKSLLGTHYQPPP